MTTNTLGGKGWLGQAKMRSKHNSKCLDSLSGNCQTPGYDVFLLGVSCPVCVLVWWRLCGVLLVCVLHCCFFPSHHSRTGRPCHLAAVPTARTPGRFRYIQSTPLFAFSLLLILHFVLCILVFCHGMDFLIPWPTSSSFTWCSLVCFPLKTFASICVLSYADSRNYLRAAVQKGR